MRLPELSLWSGLGRARDLTSDSGVCSPPLTCPSKLTERSGMGSRRGFRKKRHVTIFDPRKRPLILSPLWFICCFIELRGKGFTRLVIEALKKSSSSLRSDPDSKNATELRLRKQNLQNRHPNHPYPSLKRRDSDTVPSQPIPKTQIRLVCVGSREILRIHSGWCVT